MAVVGVVVAGYLTACQLRAISQPWDPVFGWRSSAAVLHSSLAEALPFPDAGVGAVAYGLEVVLGVMTAVRPSRLLWMAYGIIAAGMAVGSAGLIAVQVVVVHHVCSLCCVSALVSWSVAVAVVSPVRAAAAGWHADG